MAPANYEQLFDKAFARDIGSFPSRTLAYGGLGVLLSWSFTTIAVAAKEMPIENE